MLVLTVVAGDLSRLFFACCIGNGVENLAGDGQSILIFPCGNAKLRRLDDVAIVASASPAVGVDGVIASNVFKDEKRKEIISNRKF